MNNLFGPQMPYVRAVVIKMFRFILKESLWFDHEVHEEHEENIDVKTPSWLDSISEHYFGNPYIHSK